MYNGYNTPSDLCTFVEQNELHGAATLNKRSQHITPSHREFDSLLSLCMEWRPLSTMSFTCTGYAKNVKARFRELQEKPSDYVEHRPSGVGSKVKKLTTGKLYYWYYWWLLVLVNFNFWFWGDHNGGACFIISITSTHSPSQQWLNMNKNEDAIWYKTPEQ